MRCENVHPLLILADEKTLSPLAAWNLKRHLGACPACAAEYEAFLLLDARLRSADPAAGFVSFPAGIAQSLPVSPSLRGVLLIAMASIVAVVALGSLMFAPGPTAFAQVQQAMSTVRTAEWTQTETWYNFRGKDNASRSLVTKTRVRARMNPPALLFETTGRHVENREGNRFTSISLKTPDGFRTYQQETCEITFIPYEGPKVTREGVAGGLRGEIRNKLTFIPPSSAMKVAYETHKVTLYGRPALRFTFHDAPKQSEHERFTFMLWADPETKRVLRTQQESRDSATGTLTHLEVIENIHCDVPLSDAVFALNVPKGTPVYHQNYMWERGSSVTLTAQEKERVNHLIDETYAGILTGDWKRTTAGWDLRYAASIPGSPVPSGGLERWLHRKVATGHQYKVMRRLAVSGINDAPYTRVLGFGDVNVPRGTPHLVAVTLTPGILYRDALQEIGTETFYFRRDAANVFRIVGWQYSEGQRKEWRRQWLEKRKGHAM